MSMLDLEAILSTKKLSMQRVTTRKENKVNSIIIIIMLLTLFSFLQIFSFQCLTQTPQFEFQKFCQNSIVQMSTLSPWTSTTSYSFQETHMLLIAGK